MMRHDGRPYGKKTCEEALSLFVTNSNEQVTVKEDFQEFYHSSNKGHRTKQQIQFS